MKKPDPYWLLPHYRCQCDLATQKMEKRLLMTLLHSKRSCIVDTVLKYCNVLVLNLIIIFPQWASSLQMVLKPCPEALLESADDQPTLCPLLVSFPPTTPSIEQLSSQDGLKVPLTCIRNINLSDVSSIHWFDVFLCCAGDVAQPLLCACPLHVPVDVLHTTKRDPAAGHHAQSSSILECPFRMVFIPSEAWNALHYVI